MHESPRTPCRYQLCVRIYACTTSTAFTLAPCWHQIRMHHINSLHFCAFASAFNNCKPNSSAKISKKRSKMFHLAVKGIQHTSRWLKLERQQQVQKLLRTPPAQAVDDPIQTAAGTLNKFCWIEGISKPRAMAGQLEITEATSWWLSTTSATDSGRQGDPASCRPTRTTAEGRLPSHSKGSLFFFLFVSRCGPEGHKKTSPSCPAWRRRMEETDFNIGQLRRPACKGRRNEETGGRRPAEAQLTRPRRKMATRWNTRALRIHGVMKHPSIVPCMVKGAGNTAGELRTAGPSVNMLNRKRSGRGPGHMWLRWPQAEFWSTICWEHQHKCCTHTRASELEVGESPDYWSGATAWELTTPHHSWLKSERRSYGVWDTGCYCNACQLPGIAASFSMGNRLLAQHLPSLLPINRGKTAHVHTRSQDASFVLQYACATRIQGSGTLCRRQRRWTINKTTRLCIYTSVSWRSAYTCIASGQQSLSHGCVPTRKHCRSAYLCCLPSTTGRGHVSARILGWTGAAPAGTASSGQPSPAVYLHTYKSEIPQPYKRCLLSTPVLDAYRHEHPCELAQLLPVLHRIDKRSWTSICTHGRSSWHSAYRCCLLLTIGPSCVGRAGTAPTGVASCWQPAPAVYLHAY